MTDRKNIANEQYFSTDHLQTGLRTRAIKGASITMLAQAVSFGIQTFGSIILARMLSPRDFGLVAMVLAFSLLLQSFGCNGFIEAVVQRAEVHHKQISTLFWINFAISLCLALLFFMAGPLMAGFYKEPRLQPIVSVMALSIFFGGLANQHVSILTRTMQFYKTTSNELFSSFVSTGVAIFFAWRGWGYWALVTKWVTAPLMTAIGAWTMCRWRPGLPTRGTEVRPLLRFAFHTYGNFVMSYFRRNLDKIIIGRTYGSVSLGSYDRAYHLSNMLPSQVINPLYSVAISTFSKLVNDPEQYRKDYLKMISLMAFVGMPLSAALTLVSKDVILFLLGPQWDKAGRIFLAFAPSIGLIMIYITHGWLHLSLGTPERWFRWSIVEFGVTIACFLAGMPFGAIGVAVAFTVSFYILLFPALWYAGKPVELKTSAIFFTLWRYYGASLMAGMSCWAILSYVEWVSYFVKGSYILVRIGSTTVLCVLAYLIFTVFLFGGITPILQFTAILREIVKKKTTI